MFMLIGKISASYILKTENLGQPAKLLEMFGNLQNFYVTKVT